jgi:hypothetical protein
MPFSLNEFEQHLPEALLKKGLAYFRNGHVLSVEETSPGVYEAIVEGTSPYSVSLFLKNGTLTRATCDCPYRDGFYCKHMAAVIFYLQQDVLGLEPKKSRGRKLKDEAAGIEPSKRKKPGRRPAEKKKDMVSQIREKATREELMEFVMDLAHSDKIFLAKLKYTFSHYDEDQSVKRYASDVTALLKSVIGRGPNRWRRGSDAGRAAASFLSNAYLQVRKGHVLTAAMMTLGALEALTKAIQYIDDSNADIGGNIDTALNLLYSITENGPSEEVAAFIKANCLSAYKKKIFGGWDWHLAMISIAATFCYDVEDANELIRLIEEEGYQEYEESTVAAIVFQLYWQSGQFEQARTYRHSNIRFKPMRESAIRDAVQQGDINEAIKLAKEGYVQDMKLKPGLAKLWQTILIQLYEQKGDLQSVQILARQRILEELVFSEHEFDVLKKSTDHKAWPAMLKDILDAAVRRDPYDMYGKRKEILVKEGMWEELLIVVTLRNLIHYTNDYDKYLGDRFPETWSSYVRNTILEEAVHAKNRTDYQRISGSLVMLYKAGRNQLVISIVEALRIRYKHRPAMLETLSKL